MVMVTDPKTEKILIQNRTKDSWAGWVFPGGKVENSESFYDCAVREVNEETGLLIKDLTSCGIVHWINNKTDSRYLVFLYKTDSFSGELLKNPPEGELFWIDKHTLFETPKTNDLDKYFPMFFENKYSEAVGTSDESGYNGFIYK
ncbi:MAG: 8-oxo-dGTP diphosphatase [Clostridiales bacterium]|nr:8-oxo-dGTP diphosphatase [Clostridiales bacterium]